MPVTVVATFWLVAFGLIFTWGCYAIAVELLPRAADNLKAWPLAGMVLLINVPAAWFNFKGVQAQLIMTGAMMLAAAAIMRSQWLRATLWLAVAIVFKPLALVMALLCGALCPRTRLPLMIALAMIVLLPFAFFDVGYLAGQYRDFGVKLWVTATGSPHDWPYRADLTTLLQAFGIGLAPLPGLVIRVIAGFGTLYLLLRIRLVGSPRCFGFALLILSCCYINMFTPRNEYLSFVLLTPSLAVLSFLVLARDEADWRGWLLIIAALVLGMWWSLQIDSILKPAILAVTYGWLAWLMIRPERWCALVDVADASIKLEPAR
jgi:hypothetical protein